VSWGSAAFGEELLARGFILDRLAKVIGGRQSPAFVAAVFLQAAIFGAFHMYQGIGGAIVTAAAGLVLGLVWLFGRHNLWPSVLLHGLVDFLAANGL
jgi:membrane protease YdiL (CAAX protease family)